MRVFLILSLLRLSALMPLAVSHRLATLIAWLCGIIPNDLRRVTRINLQLCFPELDDTGRRRLERKSLTETVKSGLELGPMWLWSQQRCLGLIRHIHGQAELEQAVQRGRGVILAIPHIGMWEMIGLYGSSHYPMTSLSL